MFSPTPITLFLYQAVAHCLTVWWLFQSPSINDFATVFVIYSVLACFGMSMTFHRLLTHRSWVAPTWFYYFGTLCGHFGAVGSSLTWTAVHMQHHRHVDQEGDPHSPYVMSPIRAQWGSMFSPVNVKRSPLLKSTFHVGLHKTYWLTYMVLLIPPFLRLDFYVFVTIFIVPVVVLWNAGSFINTVCHTPFLGYRNYATSDRSCNNALLGILVFGEGWHNNHHAVPGSYFGKKWWELDIGGEIIEAIRKDKH